MSRPLLPGVKRAYILMNKTCKSSWLQSQKCVQGFIIMCILCIVHTSPTITVCFLCSTVVEMLSAFYINSDPAASIVSGQGNKMARCITWNSYLKNCDKRDKFAQALLLIPPTHIIVLHFAMSPKEADLQL